MFVTYTHAVKAGSTCVSETLAQTDSRLFGFFQSGSQGNLCDSWLDSPGGSPSPSSRGQPATPHSFSGTRLLNAFLSFSILWKLLKGLILQFSEEFSRLPDKNWLNTQHFTTISGNKLDCMYLVSKRFYYAFCTVPL